MTVLLSLATRLRLARLLLIAPTRTEPVPLTDLLPQVVAAGVDIVQIRHLGATAADLGAALEGARAASSVDPRLIAGIADDLDVAAELGADLFHLTGDHPGAAKAAEMLPKVSLIGRSCHRVQEVERALADENVDYVTVGPVVAAPGYEGVGGIGLLSQVVALAPPGDPASKPWFAVGGITNSNLSEILELGVRRIALSRAITAATDPVARTTELAGSLAEAWRQDPAMEAVVMSSFGLGG